MDYKQIVIDNAWGGLNMDYGMLHAQLATPVAVAVILLVMIIALNKLLFQPVLRTLDQRNQIIENSHQKMTAAKYEIEKLSQEYDRKLETTRVQVNEFFAKARQEAHQKKEELIAKAKQAGDAELERGRTALTEEVEAVRIQLQSSSESFANLTVKRFLS